jgi:hypothetical protein
VGVDALPAAFLAATRFTVAGIVLLPLAVWRVLADERPDAPSLSGTNGRRREEQLVALTRSRPSVTIPHAVFPACRRERARRQ